MHTDIIGLHEILAQSNKTHDIGKITRAYEFSARLHEGQVRSSGDPYISHPVAVAEIVAGLGLDTDAICAALLHDCVEDCAITLAEVEGNFGKDVAMLVDGVTKLLQIPFEDKEDEHMENLRKMFFAMSRDIRVIFIKLCDRLHNMRTLYARPEKKRRITALETMQVYAPLSHRLGIQKIKQELENLSMLYLDPIGYGQIKSDIEWRYGQNIDFLKRTQEQIREKLQTTGIDFDISGRVKSVYSTYKKVFENGKPIDEIYDFYALRVICDDVSGCYAALGSIHELYNMVPDRFKDYISTPKPNLYSSLHTTVIGRAGIPFEVQIRTREMHNIAEYGIAAHWKYKSGDNSPEEIDKKLSWVSKLIDQDESTLDHDEYLRTLKIDIFHDETFVFTPKGDVITLPFGSTLIDFAYAIHSEVGHRMTGAKINGIIAPIDSVPNNGQIVEILTAPTGSKGPSRDWLKIVQTSEARSKIRHWYKKEKRAENIIVGRGEVERELKRGGMALTDEQKAEIAANVASRLGINNAEDLYNTIGYGGLSMTKVAIRLKDELARIFKDEETAEPVAVENVNLKPNKSGGGGVIIDGIEGCAVKFARCCNALPGDNIIAFITKGHGVSIHKKDCPNVLEILHNPEYAQRFVGAKWEREGANTAKENTFEALVQVFAENSLMLIADITTALAEMRVGLHQINTQHKGNNGIIVNLSIGCRNTDHYKSIVSRLKSVGGVVDVARGFS